MGLDGINNKRADVSKLQQAGIHKSYFKDEDQKMKSLFDAMDTDGNGVIDEEELKNFTGIDKNNDGIIKRREAKKFLKQHKNLKEMGINKNDIIEFLNKSGIIADGIEEFSGDKENGFTVEYKNNDTKKTIDKYGNYSNYDDDGNYETYNKDDILKSETKVGDKETTTTTYIDGSKDAVENVVIKKNDGSETTTINYVDFGSGSEPTSKKIEKGQIVENYEYVKNESGENTERITSKTENKDLINKKETTYKYNNDGTYTANMHQESTKTDAVTLYNSEGKKLEETKTVDGQEYKLEYDGKGNTKGIVLQNNESIEQLADQFGCSVDQIKKLNNKENFSVGDEITVPRELEPDDEKITTRKSSQEAKAEYKKEQDAKAEAERQARIEAQKRRAEAAKRAAETPKTDEAKRAEKTKVDIEGNKKLFAKGKKQNVAGQQLVVKGPRNDGHGRMIAVNAKGEEIIFSPKQGQKDYSDATIINNDFISACDNADKCAAKGYKGLVKAAFAPNVYYSRSESGKLYAFVMGKNGKVARSININECLDKDAKIITAKLDKAARNGDAWYSFGTGLGTDEKMLSDANKMIKTPEQLTKINNYYAKKYPNWKKDGYKSPYEAFLGTEISNREIYENMASVVKNNAIKDQSRRNEIIDKNINKYGDNRANLQAGLSAVQTREDYEGAKTSAKKYMEEHPDKEKAVYGQSDLDAMIYHQSSGNADHVRAANTALTQGKEEGVIPQKDINRAKIEQAYHYANEGNYDKAIAGLNKDEIAQLDAMLQENGKKSLVNSDLSLSDKAKLVAGGYQNATPQERVKMAYQLATENKEGNLLQAAQLLQTKEEYEAFINLCERSPKLQYNQAQTINYIKEKVGNQLILKSETSIYSQEVIAQNKAKVAELRTQLETAKANIQQALAQEGVIDGMINGMREHTVGMGVTRENLEQMFRQAENELKRLDLAAEGKLVNKAGKHVEFSSLLSNTSAGQGNIENNLQDYQGAQQMTKDVALDLVITLGTMGTGGVIRAGANLAVKGVKAVSTAKKVETAVSTAKKIETAANTMEKTETVGQKTVTMAKNIAGGAAKITDAGVSAAGAVYAKDYVNAATSEAGVTFDRAAEIEKKAIDNALINTMSMGAGFGFGKAAGYIEQNASKISESMLKYLSENGVTNSAAIVEVMGNMSADMLLTDVVLDHEMSAEEIGMSIGGNILGALMARGHVHAPEPNKSKTVAPKSEPVAPKSDPVTPKSEPVAPKSDPVKPKQEPVAPKSDPVTPKQEPVAPKSDPVTPKSEPVAPKSDPVKPKQEPVAPKSDPVKPKQEPVAPKSEPFEPKPDPVAPKPDPVAPKPDPLKEKYIELQDKIFTQIEEMPAENVKEFLKANNAEKIISKGIVNGYGSISYSKNGTRYHIAYENGKISAIGIDRGEKGPLFIKYNTDGTKAKMLAEDYVELISDVKDKRLTELAKIKQQDPTPELLSKYHSAPSSEPVKYTKKTFIGTKRTVEVKTTSDVREYLKSFDNTLRNTEIEQMVKLFETNPSRFNRIANSGLFDLVDKGYIDLKTYKCLFDGIKINENIFFSNRILNECKLAKSQLEKGITPTLVKTIPDNAANDYILKNINVGDVFEQNGKLYVKSDKFGNATQINMSKKTFDELFPPVKSSAFKQGGIGDCWLVSVIDNALDYPEGRAKIFSMFEQIDNDIYVKLPGSDLNVKYINGDIVDANGKQIIGAKGIQMVEQACMCHALSTNRKNFTAQEISALTNVEEQMVMLDNGTASEAWEMLFERGATHRIYDINKIKDTIKHFSNSTDHMLYISFKEGKPIPGKREGLIDEARELWSGHAYALKSYDPKTNMCYITNPWNASKLIEVPMDEILTHIYHISDFQFT